MNDLELFFFDFSRDVAVATNFVGKVIFQYTRCSSRDIRYGGTAGIRREGQLLYRAQADKLPDSTDAGEPVN